MVDRLIKYWAQIAVILGIIGYILKTVLDYKIKKKQLRTKYFYELKAQKIVDLYTKIVEIQMLLDRGKGSANFENNIFKRRIELDNFFWESKFYFEIKTQKIFNQFLENLKFYESAELMQESPHIEEDFDLITKRLMNEFKNEIL